LEVNDSAVQVLGEPTLKIICPRAGEGGEEQRHDRLDGTGERARERPAFRLLSHSGL